MRGRDGGVLPQITPMFLLLTVQCRCALAVLPGCHPPAIDSFPNHQPRRPGKASVIDHETGETITTPPLPNCLMSDVHRSRSQNCRYCTTCANAPCMVTITIMFMINNSSMSMHLRLLTVTFVVLYQDKVIARNLVKALQYSKSPSENNNIPNVCFDCSQWVNTKIKVGKSVNSNWPLRPEMFPLGREVSLNGILNRTSQCTITWTSGAKL
jgi:hypothetical protein